MPRQAAEIAGTVVGLFALSRRKGGTLDRWRVTRSLTECKPRRA